MNTDQLTKRECMEVMAMVIQEVTANTGVAMRLSVIAMNAIRLANTNLTELAKEPQS